jgi:hypothetical protein
MGLSCLFAAHLATPLVVEILPTRNIVFGTKSTWGLEGGSIEGQRDLDRNREFMTLTSTSPKVAWLMYSSAPASQK